MLEFIDSLISDVLWEGDEKLPSWEDIDEILSLCYNSVAAALTDEYQEVIMGELEGVDTGTWPLSIYDLRAYLLGDNRFGLEGI
jgi:hypothetical protein